MSLEALTPLQHLHPLESNGQIKPTSLAGSQLPFADLLSQAMQDVAKTQQDSVNDAYDLVMGTGEDLHTIMIRSAMETAAIETAVELTTRVVGAYKEIMQMQV